MVAITADMFGGRAVRLHSMQFQSAIDGKRTLTRRAAIVVYLVRGLNGMLLAVTPRDGGELVTREVDKYQLMESHHYIVFPFIPVSDPTQGKTDETSLPTGSHSENNNQYREIIAGSLIIALSIFGKFPSSLYITLRAIESIASFAESP